MSSQQVRNRILLLAFISLFVFTRCDPNATEEPVVVEKSPEVAKVTVTASVDRIDAVAWAGNATPLPTIGASTVGLNPGGLVTTDENGQARINIQECLFIYVFQDSGQLVDAGCNQQSYTGKNGGCLVNGMSAYNVSCEGAVEIETASAGVISDGTWFAVAYLEQEELTLVLALDNPVTVRSFRELGGDPISETRLEPGNFLFTRPGDDPTVIAGLPGRTSIPFEQFPQLRERLRPLVPQLDLWLETMNIRAEEDQVIIPPILMPREPGVYIYTAGDMFEDPRVQLAMRTIAPWQDLRTRYFNDPFFNLVLASPGEIFTDFQQVAYNPEETQTLLAEADRLNARIYFIAPMEDESIRSFSKTLFSFLVENSLTVEMLDVPA
ncbi:MAG: hypothetical protein JSV61_11215, partial [Anaerolineales bacterium]